jgi:hypothetical protein
MITGCKDKKKDVSPRGYTNIDHFIEDFVARRIAGCEVVTGYHSFAAAQSIGRRNADIRYRAMDDAREAWDAYLEHMEELYERGIGPSWEGLI